MHTRLLGLSLARCPALLNELAPSALTEGHLLTGGANALGPFGGVEGWFLLLRWFLLVGLRTLLRGGSFGFGPKKACSIA